MLCEVEIKTLILIEDILRELQVQCIIVYLKRSQASHQAAKRSIIKRFHRGGGSFKNGHTTKHAMPEGAAVRHAGWWGMGASQKQGAIESASKSRKEA